MIVNGKLPTTLLTSIYRNPRYQLRAGDPANSFKRMSQRSHAKGYGFIGVADGYRSEANQERVFLSVYTKQASGNGKFNDVRWWKGYRWVRTSGTGTVAEPGYSNHGLGLSVDLLEPYMTTGPKHRWLEARCGFYGWYWEGAQFSEPWHWTFRGFPTRPTLKKGSKGDAVTAWQLVLRYDLGITATQMKADGIAGPIFDHCTRVWQKKNGLVADGVVGLKSWTRAGLA